MAHSLRFLLDGRKGRETDTQRINACEVFAEDFATFGRLGDWVGGFGPGVTDISGVSARAAFGALGATFSDSAFSEKFGGAE